MKSVIDKPRMESFHPGPGLGKSILKLRLKIKLAIGRPRMGSFCPGPGHEKMIKNHSGQTTQTNGKQTVKAGNANGWHLIWRRRAFDQHGAWIASAIIISIALALGGPWRDGFMLSCCWQWVVPGVTAPSLLSQLPCVGWSLAWRLALSCRWRRVVLGVTAPSLLSQLP